jgi:putative membrane protein
MHNNFWNDYLTWGWILWMGFIFLMFSGFGNWGYTYRVHQKYNGSPRKEAIDILNERYARGEITRVEFNQLKTDILGSTVAGLAKRKA